MVERELVFLFDENFPHRVVRAMREEWDESVVHVYDFWGRKTPDPVVLRFAGERGWIVVSSDRRILKKPQERAVLKELGMGAFFLSDGVAGFCTIVRAVVRNWPEMKRIARTSRRPFLCLVKHASVTPIRKKSLGDDFRIVAEPEVSSPDGQAADG